jgi:hypothetical protein
MKISSLSLLAVMGSTTSHAATHQPMISIRTVPGINGQYNSCPAGSAINGMCSSGKHANCLDNHDYVAFTCESNPLITLDSSSTSNWICGGAGQDLVCPSGQVMIGMCGAGENPDCHSPCASKSYGAIKCATPEVATSSSSSTERSIAVGEVQWQRPQHFASPINQCPINTVACGACQSGKDEDCKGSGAFAGVTGGFAVGCCAIETNSTKFSASLYEPWDGYHQSSSQTTVSCARTGELITGLCVAPKGDAEYQCQVNGQTYDNAVQCSKNPNPQAPSGDLATWLDSSKAPSGGVTNGNWASCPSNQLPSSISFTSSTTQGGPATMSFQCSAMSSGVQLNRTDAYAICDSYPQRLSCAPGYAMLSACAGSGCNTGACSGQPSTILGLQCVRVTGNQYLGLADGSPVADNSTASWQVVSCNMQNIDYTSASPETQATYTIDNTVTQQSSVSTTVESTQSSGTSITQSTGSQYEISSSGGLPVGKLVLMSAEMAGEAALARRVRGLGSTTDTNTTYSGYDVQTSFDTSTSYINQQYQSVTLSKTISETVYLSGGYVWDVVSWGVAVTTAGNYTVNYRQYGPGLVATSVQEQVRQTSTALSDTTYLLVLSSQYYTESYLSSTDCATIASDYMSGSEPFTNNAPVDNTNSTTSGQQNVGPQPVFGESATGAGTRHRRALRVRQGLP